MKTVYKYIIFKLHETDGYAEHETWFCVNKKSRALLGSAIYYKPWRQWVMEFENTCIFNNTCLNDISHFLIQLNKQEGAGSEVEKLANSK